MAYLIYLLCLGGLFLYFMPDIIDRIEKYNLISKENREEYLLPFIVCLVFLLGIMPLFYD